MLALMPQVLHVGPVDVVGAGAPSLDVTFDLCHAPSIGSPFNDVLQVQSVWRRGRSGLAPPTQEVVCVGVWWNVINVP